MTTRMTRYGLVVLAVVALIAVAAVAAACAGNNATTTTASDSTTTSASDSTTTGSSGSTDATVGSTDTTVASTDTSTNDTALIPGGKTKDQYQAEIPGLEKAVAADPSDLTSLEGLAVAYYQLGNYDQAAAAYRKILAISDDAFIHNALGNVYRDWQKPDQAIAEYEAAIAIDPTLKYPYINLAGVYKAKGDLQSAQKILDQARTALNSTDQKTVDAAEKLLTSTTT